MAPEANLAVWRKHRETHRLALPIQNPKHTNGKISKSLSSAMSGYKYRLALRPRREITRKWASPASGTGCPSSPGMLSVQWRKPGVSPWLLPIAGNGPRWRRGCKKSATCCDASSVSPMTLSRTLKRRREIRESSVTAQSSSSAVVRPTSIKLAQRIFAEPRRFRRN